MGLSWLTSAAVPPLARTAASTAAAVTAAQMRGRRGGTVVGEAPGGTDAVAEE